jgi:hypothetical protein
VVNRQEAEHGLKWWVRYVLVPVIGAGGLSAVLVSWIGRSRTPPSPAPSPPQIVIHQTIFPNVSNAVHVNKPIAPVPVPRPAEPRAKAKATKGSAQLSKQEVQHSPHSSVVPSHSPVDSSRDQDDWMKDGAPVRVPVTNHQKVE